MSIIDSHKTEIAKMKAELSAARKHCTNLESLIRQREGIVRRIKDDVNRKSDKVLRDVEFCCAYIKDNPNCPSKDIVAFLNNKLKDKPKRWVVLDANTFMGVMGIHLQSSGLFTSVKKVIDGNQTHTWKIK